MKTFAELVSEIEAGKVVAPVLNMPQACIFRNDRGQYVCKTYSGFIISDSITEVVDEIRSMKEDSKDDSAEIGSMAELQRLFALPTWQIIDTSLPEPFSQGVTLLSLRKELEEGKVVSPLFVAGGIPYCIRKTDVVSSDFIQYTPAPLNEITAMYGAVDELLARNFDAHLPIWQVGESPDFLQMEEQYSREREEDDAKEDALDAAPPRTIEVSEREYRAILREREREEEVRDLGGFLEDVHPF